LTLNPINREVKRAGKEIELTNKEFSLLEYLVRNAGRPVSKEQIIAHVWDYDADILPNNIEVYISYLREKVDKPFEKKLIIQELRKYGIFTIYTLPENLNIEVINKYLEIKARGIL